MLKSVLVTVSLLIISANSIGINFSLQFSTDDFTISQKDGYDCIFSNNGLTTTEKGKPLLPIIVKYFLIPPTAEITEVEIVSQRSIILPGTYLPHPAQPVRPLSWQKEIPFVQPDPAIYASGLPYPPEIVNPVTSGCLAGYRIAGVIIHPVQYLPATKQLKVYTEINLNILYEENEHESISLTIAQQELFGKEVAQLIANPEAIDRWAPSVRQLRNGEIDYVIITSSALVSNWNAFKNWKLKKGINTVVVRTDSIYSTYSGRDNQEKIRNFIKDWWQNRGLKYVLLGGDDMIVPDRKTRLVIEDSTITGNIPTDMYYADLQWSWDGNNNNLFGEMQDTVDLFHDLYIGRAPVDNATNISTFTHKDTMFEKHPDTTFIKKLLLPSQMLFSPYHGEIINNIIAGYFPPGWTISKLKDPISGATRDSLSRGYQLCHVSAHGSSGSLGVISMSQIPGLNNGIKYDIMNGINCDVGSFDNKDCIAESLVNYPNGGCIATLMNSRYGLGYPPALGPSEILDLSIFKALIVSSIHDVGAMHARAKDDCRAMSLAQSPTRWCIYENTLFGDPALPLYTEKPVMLAVTHPSSIQAGPRVVRVTVNASGLPLKNASVCAMKGTEVYSIGKTNSQGWIDLFVNPSSGTMSITVTAPNCRPYEGTCLISGSSSNPCITFRSCIIDDASGNNNQHLDPGETADLDIWLINRGSATANSTNGRLRTNSTCITIIDSTASYGVINPGDSAVGDNYRIQIASSTPQGTEIEFIVYTQSSEGNWEPFFAEIVGINPQARSVWADHDTGCCVLSVTSYGGFGTTYPYGEGSGFKYSKLASYGSLYYGSMVCGNASNYIVDRFYGQPSSGINNDFKIIDTLTPIIPPIEADEEYIAYYSDSGHASPKGLKVRQWSFMTSQPGYDDFVIVCFDYYNMSSATINNFYSGMMFDFDVMNNMNNIVRTNTARRFTYMLRSTTSQRPTVGIRLLEPIVAANLTAIDNALYVEPASMMTEAIKDSLLKGLINMPNSNRTDNWSICVSAGPFNIPAGGSARAVYAVVGGNDTTIAKVHSDSAQAWWDHYIGIAEVVSPVNMDHFAFNIMPNPVSSEINIQYQVGAVQPVTIELFDATGRYVDKLFAGDINGKGALRLHSGLLTNGIYFVKILASDKKSIKKFIYLKN